MTDEFEDVDCDDGAWSPSIILHDWVSPYQRASWLVFRSTQFVDLFRGARLVPDLLLGPTRVCDLDLAGEVVFVPLILESLVPHVVVLVVDWARERIVYYDSKGTCPADEMHTVKNANCSVLHIVALVSRQLSLWYSHMREQLWYMPFQCGAFVYNFIERYLMVPELLKLKRVSPIF